MHLRMEILKQVWTYLTLKFLSMVHLRFFLAES